MIKNHFDYIIIGNGLAGLQLALSFNKEAFFKNKTIALIDANTKNTNDKTWCFWEKEKNHLESLIHKTWERANFYGCNQHLELDLKPYTYKMIRALDFYNYSKEILQKNANIHFIIDEVNSVNNDDICVSTKQEKYSATHIFDSRITDEFHIKKNNYINIIQHFKGWVIETKQAKFQPKQMTMMDYRLKDGNQTTFMYVLPLSETKALIEFTYFTENLVSDNTYNTFLKRYISEQLSIEDYSILETEQGQIPMSTFPFASYSTSNVTKIGTAGGWVKASTGYSFKHTEKKAARIVQNIKFNKAPNSNLFKAKYKFYDKIFLKVLKDENHKGECVFTQYYKKNNIETMFRFLDEESSFLEDLQIMWSLFSFSFIKAFFKTL